MLFSLDSIKIIFQDCQPLCIFSGTNASYKLLGNKEGGKSCISLKGVSTVKTRENCTTLINGLYCSYQGSSSCLTDINEGWVLDSIIRLLIPLIEGSDDTLCLGWHAKKESAHKAFLFDVSKISICMAFGHFLAAGLKLKSLRLESSRRINISADPPAL